VSSALHFRNKASSDGLLSGLPDLPATKLIAVIAPCTKRAMMQRVAAGAADENIENDCRTDRPPPLVCVLAERDCSAEGEVQSDAEGGKSATGGLTKRGRRRRNRGD
jgi:hypothetical protein